MSHRTTTNKPMKTQRPQSMIVIALLAVALIGSGFLMGHANAEGGTGLRLPAVSSSDPTDKAPVESDGTEPSKKDAPVKEPASPIELTRQLDRLDDTVKELSDRLAKSTAETTQLRTEHDALNLLVLGLTNKTGQLDESGRYTGTVSPEQLSRRLNVDEIEGWWPLSRTEGTMTANRITLSSCWDSWDRAGVAGPDYNGTLTCKYTNRL